MAAAGPFFGMPFAIRNPNRPELLKIRNRKSYGHSDSGSTLKPALHCMLAPIAAFRAEVPMQRSLRDLSFIRVSDRR